MRGSETSKMKHSKGHIFEVAWSFATEWIRAVDMFEYRLIHSLPEDEKFFEHKGFRQDVDLHCFLMSLNRLKRAIMLACRSIENAESKQQLEEALQEFDKAIPCLSVFRNVGEHFDEYILQKGHNSFVDSRGLLVYQTYIDDKEDYLLEWLGYEININQARNEGYKLYIWWTLLSRQKKYLCEDTKSSSLTDEKRGGTSAFHVPLSTRTVSFLAYC